MNLSPKKRITSLSQHLGMTERIFASPETKRLLRSVDDGLALIEDGLETQLAYTDSVADSMSRYLLEAGGKRVRPMLLLLTAQLGAGTSADVITAAEAIEITHLGSLYHDDVMDDSDKRRGVPSAHTVWGNSAAILTGDLLFARASQLMAELGERAIRIQAGTFERLVLGQLHETVGPRPEDDLEEHYIQVLADKTGSLIAAAAQSGVIFSGADPSFEAPVVEYGEKIGIAFQLIDDVIDLSPAPEETGKVPGTDLRAGVSTLPMIYLRRLAETDAEAAALVARIESDSEAELTGEAAADFSRAIASLREHEVTARTLDAARRWADEAVAALAPLPDGAVKQALTRFAEVIVERSR